MKSYLLRHVDGSYLHRGPNSRWDQTMNRDLAERMPHTKATNILNNCISPALRKDWYLEEDERSTIIILNQESTNEICDSYDWNELCQSQFELYKEITYYGEVLHERKKQLDREIEDIHRYIENTELDGAVCHKACCMMKERLARLSHIKKELLCVDYFLSGRASDHSTGKVGRQIQGLENRYASPCVLSELLEREASPA